MIRQRVHLRRLRADIVVLRLLVSLLALALVFYGVMVVLVACKVSPHTVNGISAYRTVYDQLTAITARDITGRDRIIVAVAGVLCLIVFAPLAWRALPRPYLARGAVGLEDGPGPGHTELAPRAIERAGEVAAREHPQVDRVAGRYDTDTLELQVRLTDGADLPVTLRAIQQRVVEALRTQGMPARTVDVTLTGLAT